MDDQYNSTTAEMASEKRDDGMTQIGEFVICSHGLAGDPAGRRYPVYREEVEVAKSVLGPCRRTRWARKDVSPSAETLSNMMVGHDDGANFSISTGAIIIAASELGIVWVPDGERDALIGVNIDDLKSSPPIVQAGDEDDYHERFKREHGLKTDITFMDAITPPSQREWAVPGCILKRQVTMLYGEGAIGKSILALQLAGATVLAREWLGCKPEPGPVIYLGAEDDEDELRLRLHDIAAHFDEPMSELIENGLHASSYAGEDMTLVRFGSDGDVEPTPLCKALWERAQIVRPVMIILDTLSDIFGGDENNRAQVSAFVGLLRRLAIVANCAVIVNAHPSQSGSSSGTSGSTAWHGKVRGRLHLRAANKDEGGSADPDLRVLEFKKLQYGPLPPKMMLSMQDGVFVPAMAGSSTDPQIAGQRAEEVFMALLNRFTRDGRNVTDKKGTSYAPAAFAKEREAVSERLNKTALAEAMLRLFDSRKIHVVTEGPKSKQRSRIVAI